MNEIKKLQLPLTEEVIKSLRAGDILELSGVIYTGRDAAHKRLVELLIKSNKSLLNCSMSRQLMCSKSKSLIGLFWIFDISVFSR